MGGWDWLVEVLLWLLADVSDVVLLRQIDRKMTRQAARKKSGVANETENPLKPEFKAQKLVLSIKIPALLNVQSPSASPFTSPFTTPLSVR